MPHLHCIATECTSDSRQKDSSLFFYQLPKVKTCRRKWLCLLRREGLEKKIDERLKVSGDIRHYVVCSKHFVDNRPSVENPFPTLFSYNKYKQTTPRKTNNSSTGRDNVEPETEEVTEPCSKKAKLVKYTGDKTQICYPFITGEVELTSQTSVSDHDGVDYASVSHPIQDHDYVCKDPAQKYTKVLELQEKVSSLEVTCADLRKENDKLKSENQELKSCISKFRGLFVDKILESDVNVKHFLGLPSVVFLTGFLSFVSKFYDKISFWKGAKKSGTKQWQQKNQDKPGKKRKLSMKEELVLVLLKLRQGFDNFTLSVIFDISVGQVSNLFSTWINFLSQLLETSVIKWPSSKKIKKYMPVSFKLKYPNTTCIIDCTEVFVQKPKNSSAQATTWSNYKTHNTLKALVAIQPNGAFIFVSKFWSGNISDRKITIDSKFLDKISAGDEVMADRGFQIRDLLTMKGAYLNMPPFTRQRRNGKGRMLTSKEIVETRKIASVRIHVERAIRRLKSFKLLGGVLSLNMKDLSSSILKVAAALCNFMPPLVNKFK